MEGGKDCGLSVAASTNHKYARCTQRNLHALKRAAFVDFACTCACNSEEVSLAAATNLS